MNCARAERAEVKFGCWALTLLGAMAASAPALAQQKTGPGISGDDSLTWQGITLYGVIDVGLQYDTHSAPFSPYRPAASGNIVRQNSLGSVVGLTPSNMGQSRVGLHGSEPLVRRLVGGISDRELFQSAIGPNRGFPEVAGREQWPGPCLPKRRGRRQFRGAGLSDRLCRPEIAALRQPDLRPSGHVAGGRHHQVRPQLQRDGVWPARCIQHVFRAAAAARTTGSTRP